MVLSFDNDMKRREMNHVARSLCEYLMSRNNDIASYWGMGVLCQNSIKDNRVQFHFRVRPGELLRIYSYEILGSQEITDKLVKHNLDTIEGRLSFFEDDRQNQSNLKIGRIGWPETDPKGQPRLPHHQACGSALGGSGSYPGPEGSG